MISIRRHLLQWLLGASSLGAVLLAAATYAFALDEMNEVCDEQLKQVALTVLAQAGAGSSASSTLGASARDLDEYAFVTQIWTLGGTRLATSAAEVGIPFVAEEGFSTASTSTGPWRVYTDRSTTRFIQAAQPIAVRRALAADVALKILIPGLLAAPLLALLLAYALRRGLLPLTATAEDIGRRSAASLDAVEVAGLPAELRPLVVAINGLMGKLAAALAAQRQLTADAAHELRTPLTAVRLQVRALTRAADEASRRAAAEEVEQGVRRATHVIHQLLSLCRVEPDASPMRHERVDLAHLARQVVGDFSRCAEAKAVDLGAVVSSADGLGHIVLGDREQLQVLLNNLVDNAVRYTPAGGRVDVCVSPGPGADQVSLAVIDSGPGLPAAEHDRIFDRFYRGSTARVDDALVEGSGLGLAIVKAAAGRHGAVLDVGAGIGEGADCPGLRVRAVFPRRQAAPSAARPRASPFVPADSCTQQFE